ncbi:hypothetical protein [Brevibacillus brevis]|uniref:Uncharacterized protein n=1 Tax=Brevibacillus brevis TaxID=1393 RepID=A0ABY9SWC3_BREBE|nr:hypothetical protein [Brevibacillus brevis]WNC12127.1 hypothetical protein RGB73_15390 [Brevibacillus brevis]
MWEKNAKIFSPEIKGQQHTRGAPCAGFSSPAPRLNKSFEKKQEELRMKNIGDGRITMRIRFRTEVMGVEPLNSIYQRYFDEA